MFLMVDKYHNLAHEKETDLHGTAAICKIINELYPTHLAIQPADLGVWCFDSGVLQGDVFSPILY